MTSRSNWHHGGDRQHLAELAGCEPQELLDFSANMNPLGPPDWLRPTISAHIEQVLHYPDPYCEALSRAAVKRYGLDPARIVWGNGASQLLFALPRVLRSKHALLPTPCYSDYSRALQAARIPVTPFPLLESEGFQLHLPRLEASLSGVDLVLLGRPNNPTGLVSDQGCLAKLVATHPKVMFVVDEAFMDFLDDRESLMTLSAPNLIIVRSLTKFFCIPGLRLGFVVAPPTIASALRQQIPAWSVNALAQAVGIRGLEDAVYASRSKTYLQNAKQALANQLRSFSQVQLYPSRVNFLLLKLTSGSAKTLATDLLAHKIAIRTYGDDVLDHRFFRIAVRSERENQRLIEALNQRWKPGAPALSKTKTPAVMFQGSGSNVGKSMMAAAMCRVMLQDGYDVAPFKAQNMSLNAFVTREGKEMARAQVVQAQACRLEPDWPMNPILLKPSGHMRSQVIFCGEPLGHQGYSEYREKFPEIKAQVHKVYDQLSSQHQVMVLEGAGSPGEVNLKDRDLVNMSMAAHAEAAVILVGDIDRGGVFASFMGTMNVLAEWERDLVAGYLINRFRGDVRLLDDALDYLQRYTGRETFGVMPFMQDLGLPEEDSMGFRQNITFRSQPTESQVDVAIIDLPHIANFTDFDPFTVEPEVSLRLVRSPDSLGTPHAIILPGSKQMVDDLGWLRQTGLAQRIKQLSEQGHVEIVGLCGGLQMLGISAKDPKQVEASAHHTPGLALLPISTFWLPIKTTRQVHAIHQPSGLPVVGYEIHHGQSGWGNAKPWFTSDNGTVVGVAREDRPLWGTYLHGLFENDGFRRWWIDQLRKRQGLPKADLPLRHYHLEPALDRLADLFRESVDVSKIYRAMGLR